MQVSNWQEILESSNPTLVGILNVTPDSFSDGGRFLNENNSFSRVTQLLEQGATVIDVGAESTRRGAGEVEPNQQLERLEYLFDQVRQKTFGETIFSIDTRHASVAREALLNGFAIVNDVSGASFDPEMAELISQSGALTIVMHSRGTPETMKSLNNYDDVIKDTAKELMDRVRVLESVGVDRSKIAIDPGIGFAKSPEQSLELIANARFFVDLGYPVMYGVSRKSVIGHILETEGFIDNEDNRDKITADVSVDLVNKGVQILRIHNVGMVKAAIDSF